MTLKLKLIACIAFVAGQLFAYAIASSPLSPINKAEASPLTAPTMLVSECAMRRTPEVIRIERIMTSMAEPSRRQSASSASSSMASAPTEVRYSQPRPQRRPRTDAVAQLINNLE